MRSRFIATALAVGALALSTASAPAASAATVTSTPWNGYVTSANIGSDTDVMAQWQVPKLTCSAADYAHAANAAQWVGLGGVRVQNQPTDILVQVGIVSQCGVPNKAFYEVVPPDSSPVPAGHTAKPGDYIFAEVQYLGGGEFQLTLDDSSSIQSWSFSKTLRVLGETHKPNHAEWIIESGNGNLANFGSVTFYQCYYTGVGDPDGALLAQFDVNKFIAEATAGRRGVTTPKTSVSAIGPSASFTIKWLHS